MIYKVSEVDILRVIKRSFMNDGNLKIKVLNYIWVSWKFYKTTKQCRTTNLLKILCQNNLTTDIICEQP